MSFSLAIDQLRLRRPDDPWLIPVRFDNCEVPDRDLGSGRTLGSIHRADLFGSGRDLAAERLVAAVHRLLRESSRQSPEGPNSEQVPLTAVPIVQYGGTRAAASIIPSGRHSRRHPQASGVGHGTPAVTAHGATAEEAGDGLHGNGKGITPTSLSQNPDLGPTLGESGTPASRVDPVQFAQSDEIFRPITRRPATRHVDDILEELAAGLRRGDQSAVIAAVRLLKRRALDPAIPTDRRAHQLAIKRLGLLREHPVLHPATSASVYRALLMAFGDLSYESYCAIEDCLDEPPHKRLKSEMLKLKCQSILPWLLTTKSGDGAADEDLMEVLHQTGVQAARPLQEFQRDAAIIRPGHRALGYEFAVQYLLKYAEDPQSELVRRGYLADILEAAFPGSPSEQQARLVDMLRFTHGKELSKDTIGYLCEQQGALATQAFRAAAASLEASRMPNNPPIPTSRAHHPSVRLQPAADHPKAHSARNLARLNRLKLSAAGPSLPKRRKDG